MVLPSWRQGLRKTEEIRPKRGSAGGKTGMGHDKTSGNQEFDAREQ
jgi:hypothetical protein